MTKFIPLAKLKLMRAKQKTLPKLPKISKPCKVSNASLRAAWPPIYDQGEIGSCTANAFCACFKYVSSKKDFDPSRMYVYYHERLIELPPGGTMSDSGASVSDGRQWAHDNGVCCEHLWPYDVAQVNTAPSQAAETEATHHKIGESFAIVADAYNSVKSCICIAEPVMIAFGVYQSFMSINGNGIMPVPNPVNYEDPNDPIDPFLGGHEVAIMGFNDATQQLMCANSWGAGWGDSGFFYMPYAVFNNAKIVYALDVLKPF